MARESKTFDAKTLNTLAEDITSAKMALALLVKMGKEITADEAVIRYARRELALYKDQARKQSGAAAEHKYTPDLSNVEDEKIIREAAGFLVEVAETFSESAVEAHKAALAAEKAARKASAKPAPVEAAKPARKARKAAPVEAAPVAP